MTEGVGGSGLHMFSVYGYDREARSRQAQHAAGSGSIRSNRRARRSTMDRGRRLESHPRRKSIGGFIAAGDGQIETCVPEKGEHRVLDFLIVGPGFRETAKKVELVLSSTIATHRP
eukprot:12213000-Heterocapsa_arctica.AAC.1